MELGATLRVSVRVLWRNRTRSILTVLGILIGISSVVMVTALSSAASSQIGGQLDSMGTNTVYVNPAQVQQSGRRTSGRLNEGDLRAILAGSVSVAAGAPFLSSTAAVSHGELSTSSMVAGTTIPYFKIRRFEVVKGEMWQEADERLKSRVCILGGKVAERLFGSQDPIGQTVRIGRFPFRIIGVLKTKTNVNFLSDEDNRVMMPIGTYRGRIVPSPPGRTDLLLLSASAPDTTPRAVAQVTDILRSRHRIAPGAENDFRIATQSDFRRVEEMIFSVLSALLLAVASVSLFVGGVGVMNIMLVSVSERTREIGIRMSVGARANEIQTQFLLEAIVLSCVGGILGSLFGIGGALALGFVLDWAVVPNVPALALALLVSSLVGIVFGLFPARRAANLDPIEALRVD